MSVKKLSLSEADLSRLIEMAWEDRTPFEAILKNFHLDESSLMRVMQKNLRPSSYRLWRKRVKEKSVKHLKLRSPEIKRAYCPTQYKISH
ncbi:MAG: TIGR03643 family protein [Betaproteobacteria bacterium]|nr:TIGR03643 family protein [Betaproteobacteria bacterium]